MGQDSLVFKLLFIVVRLGVPSYYLVELSERQIAEMHSLRRHHPNKHLSDWAYISCGRDVQQAIQILDAHRKKYYRKNQGTSTSPPESKSENPSPNYEVPK